MDAWNLVAHRFGGHSTRDADESRSRLSCEHPIHRLENCYASKAFPTVKSLSKFCLNLDSVGSAMWNLGRGCRIATIGYLSKIQELTRLLQVNAYLTDCEITISLHRLMWIPTLGLSVD